MSIIESRISNRSDEFRHNSSAMQELVADLRARAAAIAEGGGERAREKHLGRGKLWSTRVRRFSKSASSPVTRCTAMTMSPPAG
jgi:hypothetical protein